MRPDLTLNFGLRYEYFSPYAEKYGRLTNLLLTFNPASNPSLVSAMPVTPNGTSNTMAVSTRRHLSIPTATTSRRA